MMDNISINAVWEATVDARLMFYLVTPSEAIHEHVKDVPNYTEKVCSLLCDNRGNVLPVPCRPSRIS